MIILTDGEEFNLEALTEATIILCLGVFIIVSNVLIIATYLNARGQYEDFFFNSGGKKFS